MKGLRPRFGCWKSVRGATLSPYLLVVVVYSVLMLFASLFLRTYLSRWRGFARRKALTARSSCTATTPPSLRPWKEAGQPRGVVHTKANGPNHNHHRLSVWPVGLVGWHLVFGGIPPSVVDEGIDISAVRDNDSGNNCIEGLLACQTSCQLDLLRRLGVRCGGRVRARPLVV